MAYRRRYFEGEVTTPAIVTEAVTEDKIADDAVTSAKIKDGTITGADIGVGQVQTDDIADGAVTARKLGSDVSVVPLADNSVSTAKIQDNAVVTEKIATGAVDSSKLAAGSVESTKIKDGAVTNTKIATNAVSKSKMTDNSVGYLEIINGSIEPRHIRAVDSPANGEIPSYNQLQERFEWIAPEGGGVTRPLAPPVATDEIGAGAVGSSQLAVDSVSTEKIQNGAVTKAKLSYKVISITIPALQVGGLFPPLGDPDLNGGVILGYSIPVNQDQLIRQLFLLPGLPQGTGISILLNQPAIADNTFDVVVLRG
ncbi:MAG: hypothetical protein V1871_07630 [Planctomycetota bacterium]